MDWHVAAWVATGSAGGGLARWWISELLTRGDLPWGTLTVNVLGSFLLGLLLGTEPGTEWVTPAATAAVGVGFLGSFTTMSTFSYETVALGSDGSLGWAIGYLAITLVACLAGALVGRWGAQSI
jgi:CrcB protein